MAEPEYWAGFRPKLPTPPGRLQRVERELVLELTLGASYNLLTKAESLELWLGDSVRADSRLGGRLSYRDKDQESVTGAFSLLDLPKKVEFTDAKLGRLQFTLSALDPKRTKLIAIIARLVEDEQLQEWQTAANAKLDALEAAAKKLLRAD